MIFDHFLSFEDVDIALQHTSIDIGDSPLSSSSYRHSSDRKTDYNSNNIENSIKNTNINSHMINNNFIRNINYLNNGENNIDKEREREREKERERERRERVIGEEERVVTELSDNNYSMMVSDGRTDKQVASPEKKSRNVVIDSNKDKQRDRDRNDVLPSSSSSSSSSSSLKRNTERYHTRKFLNSTPSSPPHSSSSSSTSSQARTVDCNPFPVLGMTSPILAPHSNFDSPNASIHHLDDFNESCNDVTSSTLFVRRGSAAKDMLRRASLLSPRGVMNTAMKRKHADMSLVSTTLPHCHAMDGRMRYDDDGEHSSVRVNQSSAEYESSMLDEDEGIHRGSDINMNINRNRNRSSRIRNTSTSTSACAVLGLSAAQGMNNGGHAHGQGQGLGHGSFNSNGNSNSSMLGNGNGIGGNGGIGSMREREREEVEETLFGDFAEGTSRFVTRRPRTDSIRYLTLPPLTYPILPYPILSYSILSSPTLSYPLLLYPILSLHIMLRHVM